MNMLVSEGLLSGEACESNEVTTKKERRITKSFPLSLFKLLKNCNGCNIWLFKEILFLKYCPKKSRKRNKQIKIEQFRYLNTM
jgi:hypothetical protein